MLQEYMERLVQMSGSNSDVDILKGEITILEGDRVKLVRKLNRLQAEANPERYFDPAAQLADQQEKLRLGQKIAAKEDEHNEVETSLSICKDEEAAAHRELVALKERQQELATNKKTIEQRLEAAKLVNNEASIANYSSALQTCMEELAEKDGEVSIAEAGYQVIASKLETISENLRNIETTLNGYQQSRDEIDAKLSNPNAYMNQAFQEKEMKAIAEVEQDIAKIDARLTEIQSDPVMLADEIKAKMQVGDESEVLSLMEKLAHTVEAMPYASLIGAPELEEALKDATLRKEAIEATIAASDYTNITSADLVETRISYLQNRISFFESEQQNISALIAQLDNDELFHTKDCVAQAKSKKAELKSTVSEYEAVVKNSASESTLKRANLGRALSSKAKDLNTAENIYTAFVDNQREDINIAANLEANLLTVLQEKIKSCKEQLASVKGLSSKKKSEKDIIAEARDKRLLAEANEEIAKIERWKQYEMSPKQMISDLKGQYQAQQVEATPVLEPIVPDAFSLQDSVDLGTTVLPEISLEEIPYEPAPDLGQSMEPGYQTQQDIPAVPAMEESLHEEEPVVTPMDVAPQFEVPVVPVAETQTITPVVEDAPVVVEPLVEESPALLEPAMSMEQEPVNMNTPAEDIPVAPFAGFGEEATVAKEQTDEVLPPFEEPKEVVPNREIHKVVRIEDLANIHSTATAAPEAVDTTLDADTEYLGFEDYTGLKVA